MYEIVILLFLYQREICTLTMGGEHRLIVRKQNFDGNI